MLVFVEGIWNMVLNFWVHNTADGSEIRDRSLPGMQQTL